MEDSFLEPLLREEAAPSPQRAFLQPDGGKGRKEGREGDKVGSLSYKLKVTEDASQRSTLHHGLATTDLVARLLLR